MTSSSTSGRTDEEDARVRRSVLLSSASLACQAAAPVSSKTIKVGIILTYSGPDASIGEAIDRGAELYLALHRSELPAGVELQLIKRDETGPTPDIAKRLARELIVREGVQILTGGQWTPNVSAIAPLATEAGIPYVVMSSGTASTTRLSPFLVRVAFTTWQHSYHMGKWAAMNGLTRASTIVSDYAAGVDAEDAFVPGFTDGGGTDRQFGSRAAAHRRLRAVPRAYSARQASGPVRVQPRRAGSHAVHQSLSRPWTRGSAGIQLIGPNAIVPDDELKNMGEAAINVISASHYSAAGDRPANRTFVSEWKKAYGQDTVPNYFAVGGWDGMAAIFDVIRAQNGELDARANPGISDELEQPRQPSRPDAHRPRDPRCHPQHLHPSGAEGRWRTAQRGIRDHPDRERSRGRSCIRKAAPAADARQPAMFELVDLLVSLMFYGTAYGMVLYLLAVGPLRHSGTHAVRQPRAWRVCHGGRLSDGHRDVAPRSALPRRCARLRGRGGRAGDAARTHAVPAPLRSADSGAGALLDRPHLRVELRSPDISSGRWRSRSTLPGLADRPRRRRHRGVSRPIASS